MLLRRRPEGFYAYPDHRPWWSRLLWRVGLDHLTVYERLAQVRREADDWKRWFQESETRAKAALNELGVPNEGYPAPVANAVSILHGKELPTSNACHAQSPADNPSAGDSGSGA